MSRSTVSGILFGVLVLVVIVGGSIALAGISGRNADVAHGQRTMIGKGVWRVYDVEAGVVCWTNYGNGIDCLPIEETDVERVGERVHGDRQQ